MTAGWRHPAGAPGELAAADVVVVGGGPAGLGAALGAARAGARVVCLERHGFCGGNLTAASIGTICGLYLPTGRGFDRIHGGVADELADELAAAGAGLGPVPFKQTAVFLYVPWVAKRLADALLTTTEGITLLLHSLVADVVATGGVLDAVVVATKRGPMVVRGRVFVDCSGDADVAAFSGAPTVIGEPTERQAASMQFVMQHVDVPAALGALGRLGDLIEAHGGHLSRDAGAFLPTGRPGEVIVAMTRVRLPDGSPPDVTDPRQATAGELEGRRRAEEAAEFLRAHVPGFAEAFLADTAPALGVRESRRVVGRHVLSGAEVDAGATFPDAVARGAWPREYHTRGRSTDYHFLAPGVTYDVPYRCLVPRRGPSNLLVAGRCLSADADALASVRVVAPCLALGQAAGVAAALAARGDGDVAAVEPAAIRSTLRAQGARLPP